MYEVKLTQCAYPQEESKYRYRPPGISQKPPETAENNRGCFCGKEKRGRTGGRTSQPAIEPRTPQETKSVLTAYNNSALLRPQGCP
jgi:hypothetical protein